MISFLSDIKGGIKRISKSALGQPVLDHSTEHLRELGVLGGKSTQQAFCFGSVCRAHPPPDSKLRSVAHIELCFVGKILISLFQKALVQFGRKLARADVGLGEGVR